MSSEKPVTVRSVSQQRRERSKSSGKKSGFLLTVILVISLGGATWYLTQVFLPDRSQRLYDEETVRVSEALSQRVSQLTEWSTEAVLDSSSEEIRLWASRDGVEVSMADGLARRVNALKELREQRMAQYEGLLTEALEFPASSSREEILAFDERVRTAKGNLERRLGSELQDQWQERRKAIVAAALLEPAGELTIRSDPSSADVYIDGQLVAKTPFKASGVRSGSHEIMLKKKGFRDKGFEVSIGGGTDEDVGIQILEPIIGSVRIRIEGGKRRDKIEVEIEEASEAVSVGGLEVVSGYQYFEGRDHDIDSLRIGNYKLIVSRNGNVVERSEFVIKEDVLNTILINL